MNKISIVIPFFNEVNSIETIVSSQKQRPL
jgi:glycosyltransferase involved in cell wall biosynthesis